MIGGVPRDKPIKGEDQQPTEDKPGGFPDALAEARAEAAGKVGSGSSSKTPWSSDNWGSDSDFGVTVPKTFDEIFVETGTVLGLLKASDPTSSFYASRRKPSDVPSFYSLPANERNMFNAAAEAIHPLKTGQGLYEELIQASWDLSTKGVYISPQELAYRGYQESGGKKTGGKYTGPVTTSSVSLTAKPDIERTLNTFAVDMLGRNLTDEELKKYTSEYSKQEMNAPQVVTTTPQGKAASSSVTQNTVSRETIAKNILQDNPTFADNVIKTDVLDMFFKRLGGAASGS